MIHYTTEINHISGTLCYFSLRISIKPRMTWISQSVNIEKNMYRSALTYFSVCWLTSYIPLKWNDNSSPNRAAMTGLMIKKFSLQSSLSFCHSLSSHGFPVPEERYKYWTPLERQAAIMFCEAGRNRKLVVPRMMSLFSLQQSIIPVFSVLCWLYFCFAEL